MKIQICCIVGYLCIIHMNSYGVKKILKKKKTFRPPMLSTDVKAFVEKYFEVMSKRECITEDEHRSIRTELTDL